jgi:hypothetical protein
LTGLTRLTRLEGRLNFDRRNMRDMKRGKIGLIRLK